MKPLLPALALAALSACATLPPSLQPDASPAAAAAAANAAPPPETLDPTPPPPPPEAATTVEEFDTTTEEDRAEAVAEAAGGEERLGTTIASLGDPAQPGIWIETPYVSEVTPGRVEVAATGQGINIELRPSGGAPGSGSEISLPALRLLGVPLTDLPELVVYRL